MHIGVAVGKVAVAGPEELAGELIDFVGIFGSEVIFLPGSRPGRCRVGSRWFC